MASTRGTSVGGITVATTTTTSPKSHLGNNGGGGGDTPTASVAPNSSSSSPKGHCLCSPTTHQGSFRCKFHRSTSTAYFKRSKSMPPNDHNHISSISPKSVESA